MRCADIFHPLRPFAIHKRWALAMAKEFSCEGYREVARGIRPSLMKDPCTYLSSLGKETAEFIEFLVIPVYACLIEIYPGPKTNAMIGYLRATQKVWQTYDDIRGPLRTAVPVNTRNTNDIPAFRQSTPLPATF